ncbi:prepilin-type N-terminal cleavage/methylation domain-containing protein [Oceanobacillus sp. CAU 1775]
MKNIMENQMENFKKDERGMTLVELLAVVVILVIVGLIAFVAIGNVIENSRKDAHISNALQVINAAELYEASGSEISKIINATELNTLNPANLVNPWDNSKTGVNKAYDFQLQKNDNDTIEITAAATSGAPVECTFNRYYSKIELIDQGRKLCKN